MVHTGERVAAILSASNDTVNFLGGGVYNGMKPSPMGFDNPNITLDTGEEVWGYECWWGPEDKVKAKVATYDKIINVSTNGTVLDTAPVTTA